MLGLAFIDLGGECLTCADSLTNNGSDVVVLCLGSDGGLDFILEVLALLSSRALLQLTIVGEVGTKASKEGGSRPSMNAWQILTGSTSWSMNGREAARI